MEFRMGGNSISNELTIYDGCVLQNDEVVLVASCNSTPEISRVIFSWGSGWRHFDVPTDSLISVSTYEDSAFLVGSNGSVIKISLHKEMTVDSFESLLASWVIKD